MYTYIYRIYIYIYIYIFVYTWIFTAFWQILVLCLRAGLWTPRHSTDFLGVLVWRRGRSKDWQMLTETSRVHTHTVGCQYLYVAKKWTTHWEAAYTIPWNAETGRSRERAKLTSWCLTCKPKKWWPTYGYMLPILWDGHKSINSDGKTHNKVNKDLQGFPFFLSWYIQVRPNQWSLHTARALWGDIAKQLRAQAPLQQVAEFISHEAIIPRYPTPNCQHIATCSFEQYQG